MQYLPWNDRLKLFRSTLDRIIHYLQFRSVHEYNTFAKVLEEKAMFLRFEADELLSKNAEVQTLERGFDRSADLIENGR